MKKELVDEERVGELNISKSNDFQQKNIKTHIEESTHSVAIPKGNKAS